MQIIYKDSEFPKEISKSVFVKTTEIEYISHFVKALKKLGYEGTVLTNFSLDPSNIGIKEPDVDYEMVADVIVDLNNESMADVEKAIESPFIQRVGGEAYVPAYIWKTAQFQSWYNDLKKAGNSLEKANLLYAYTTPSGFIFSYMMKVSIWVKSENRYKSNEIIVSRRNVSNVIAYSDSRIVLIKEFRSPVSNKDGFVYELPGGSSFDDSIDPLENARTEFFEEVGYLVKEKNRFTHVADRQLAATVTTHKTNLYALKLEEDEVDKIAMLGKEKERDITFIGDSDEHTYVVVINKDGLFDLPVDFSTIGMIASVIR
jgi:8-oxo-dGTP pyrophosphatase MutT (NUDIX family)